MSSPTGGNGQAPTRASVPGSGNGQAPTTPPHNTTSSGSPDGGQNGQAPTANDESLTPPSAEEWRRHQQELAEARREAAALRTEKKQRDDAQLSQEQKRERDFTDLQTAKAEQDQKVQRLTLEIAGLRLAPSLGITDAAAALALVQVEHAADIKYTSDGAPENLESLLKDVLKHHPALGTPGTPNRQAPAPSSGGATNPGRSAGNGGLTLESIKAMPMRERIARMDEIRAWEKANQTQS